MILDLGTLRGDVLLFGGPYGNLQATEALLAAASRLAIPAGNLVCTGDLVAYINSFSTAANQPTQESP